MEWLGVVSMVCFTACYLPQLARTFKTRNVEGVSTVYWLIVVLGYVTGLVYIQPLGDWVLLVTYSVGFACALAMVLGCFAFRTPSRSE